MTKTLWIAQGTMAAVVLAGCAFGVAEHLHASRLTEALAAARQASAPAACAPSATLLGTALSVALTAHQKGATKRPVAVSAPARPSDGSFDDLSSPEQQAFFDGVDKIKDTESKRLAEVATDLRLTERQQRLLRERIEKMNERVGAALDHLIALASQKDPVPTRKLVDAAAEGLNAIREADDSFRAELDDEQREKLEKNGFDLISQVDPSVLVSHFLAFAGSSSSAETN